MNARTGATYYLEGLDAPKDRALRPEDFPRWEPDEPADLTAAREAVVVRGEPVFPVAPEVAQAVQLGRRELDRRKRRRKAAKQARKRNR